jgi:hypothetical protein
MCYNNGTNECFWGRSVSTWIAKPEVHVEDVILLVKKAITNKINVNTSRKFAVRKLSKKLLRTAANNRAYALVA